MTKGQITHQHQKNAGFLQSAASHVFAALSMAVMLIGIFSSTAIAWNSNDPYDYASKIDKVGVYVTPKLGWSYVQANDIQSNYSSSALGASYSESTGEDYGKSTFAAGLAVGYDLSRKTDVPIRTELEYMYRSDAKYNDSYDWGGVIQNADLKMQTQTVFINTFVDIPTGTAFTPYIGAGAGVAVVKSTLDDSASIPGIYRVSGSSTETETNFAWNVGAGGAFSFNEHVALDVNYRYVDMGTGKASANTNDPVFGRVKSKYEADMTGHEVIMGLRFNM